MKSSDSINQAYRKNTDINKMSSMMDLRIF